MNFPIFKTKVQGVNKKFDLNNPEERREYFEAKAGKEIAALQKYLEKSTFIAYLLGKKNSGKGTYSKMFGEVVGPEKVAHLSVGDMVRKIDLESKDKNKKKELYEFLEKNYRGWIPLKEIISSLEKRSTKTLLSTELVLTLIKREIAKMPKKAIFIDGFPREMDQISYSLFFRDLIDYRQDPDIFVLIDVPTSVIDERIKFRRICPLCQTSRNIKLFPTSRVKYDEKKKKFDLFCDNPNCRGAIMVSKEGDEFGTKPIKGRLQLDEKLINMAFNLHGIPKVFLRNSISVKDIKKFTDDYEITPEYVFQWDKNKKEVKTIEKPWVMKDDAKIPSVSLLAPPVALSMIKQLAKVLKLV